MSALATALPSWAQACADRPIPLLVPLLPGGPTDTLARDCVLVLGRAPAAFDMSMAMPDSFKGMAESAPEAWGTRPAHGGRIVKA